MNLPNYILQILKSRMNIVMSWGFHRPMGLENGLMFQVNGFKHQGTVLVKYNEGLDLFEIHLIDKSDKIIKEFDHIYFDQLVEVIDNAVEKTDDYQDRLNKLYNN